VKTIVVLLDDAGYARQQLAPRPSGTGDMQQQRWILVACAPRMTHRVSKWVSHGAREHWRSKWAHKLFGELDGWLVEHHPDAERVLARGPLPELLEDLQADEVLDLRRPKGGLPTQEPGHQPGSGRVLGSLACAWLSLAGMVEA
jgi:hypothetical protein